MRVDVHAHLLSDEYLDRLARYGRDSANAYRGLGAGTAAADLETRFALLDEAGIDRQVLSVSPHVPHFPDRDHAISAARHANDLYAEATHRWPDRFAAFVALPLPHLDAALAELALGLDELGMLGAAITTDVLGTSLADPSLTPLFEELNRRGAVLYVHPSGHAAGTPLIADHRMRWSVGAPVEDTIAAAHLILAGIPSRYPAVKIINSHFGGALPMLLPRMDHQYVWESPSTPEAPSIAARRMWYDTVGHGHHPALRVAADTLGVDRLVLGTDFPYQNGPELPGAVRYVEQTLPAVDAELALDRTAAALLGLSQSGRAEVR